MDDFEDLIRQSNKGDRRAAVLLVHHLTPVAYRYAARMVGNTAAEDITQEAMIRFWQHLPRWIDGKAKPSTWLFRTITNLCIDHQRAQRPHTTLDATHPDNAPTPEATTLAAQRAALLHAALAELSERQRAALILRHFDDLSNPEIAFILETSVEAVESLLTRGKRSLANLLPPLS